MAHWVVVCTTEADLANREPMKCCAVRMATTVFGRTITTTAEAIAVAQEYCTDRIQAELPNHRLSAWHAYLE